MNNITETSNIVPSGYRILYVLSLLLNSKLSQKEINEKLSSNPCVEQEFTKDTLLKIINTLKAADIKITKSEGKYYILQLPWDINEAFKNLNPLINLGRFVRSLGQEELFKNYRNFLLNLARYFPEDTFSELLCGQFDDVSVAKYQKYLQLIKKVEQANKNHCRIKVSFGQESCVFDSYFLEYDATSVFLGGYNVKAHENIRIKISDIKSLKQLPQKSSGMFFPACVTFKVKGRLAKSYNLREHEKLIAFDNDDIVVANKGEDRVILLRRLLKYKELCEVIAPEAFREDFVTMLKKTLAAYESLENRAFEGY